MRSQRRSEPGSTRLSSTTSSSARTRSRAGPRPGKISSRARRLWLTVPETFDFEGLELARRAGLEPFERQARIAAPVEPRDRVADGLEPRLGLVLAALVDR